MIIKKEVKNIYKIGKELFITSDEDIMIGDYYIAGVDIYQCLSSIELEDLSIDSFCKKIVLTTDPLLIADGVQAIDDEFLEWFVKNPSCEFVEVKKGCKIDCTRFIINGVNSICCGDKEYKIILPKEEPKQEIWKDIPNYEGLYQVSNFGNVKSLERYVKGKVENRLQKENILSKRLVGNLGNQYYAVTLCNNKDRKQIKVSVLVAMSFLNHTPNGYVGFTVDHIDNNPLNNNVDNLQVITKRENSSKDRKGISKYTGVTFNKKSNKWRSQIWINGKNKTLGSFDDELEAHRAYQKELQQHLKS
jgi:frataxin-like iron-binding protein CyaY